MQQLAGRHVQARCLDACLRNGVIINQWCSPAPVYRCHTTSCSSQRVRRPPHRLHVSCPAVEQQDTEVPSTSGRTAHSDGDELIQSLLGHEAVMEVLEEQQQQQQPSEQKQLIKRIQLCGSLPLLCELVQAEAHHFDHKVTAQALHRLSILGHAYFTQLQSAHLTSQEAQQAAWVKYVDPALKALGQLLLQHMDSCDSWTVAISLWAYGHLQYSEDPVLAALSDRGSQLLHDFNTIDCASALVGMAKLTGPRTRSQREFMEQLMTHTHLLLSHVDEWSARDIVSVVWALSQLGAAGPARRPLLQGLVEMTLWRLHEFGVKELVITIYSLGRLRMRLPLQMVKLTNQIMKHLGELKPQDAANLVYSCAKVQFKQPELLQKLPHVVLDKLSSFKPQEVANLLYGYGQLHFLHPLLLDSVAKACAPRLHEFSTQDLCLTVWAYGAVGYCPADTTLFESACQVFLQRKERLLPLQITMVIKGFSRAGYQPPATFMQQMSQLALAKLPQFSPLEYSQLLWAYSTAGYRDVQLFESVVAHAIHQLHTKSPVVSKTTVDTMVVACQGVGFWPQLLITTAEINGLYVKAKLLAAQEQAMQTLSTPAPAAAAAAAAAEKGEVEGEEEEGGPAVVQSAGTTAAAAEAAAAAAVAAAAVLAAGASDAAHRSGSSTAVASAVSAAFAAGVDADEQLGLLQADAPVAQQRQQQQQLQPQQQHLQDQQQQVHVQEAQQAPMAASGLDRFGLQRPQPPSSQQRQRQQQQGHLQQQQQQPNHQVQPQPPPPPQQQQQQLHPHLQAQLLPPPMLPQPQQGDGAVPAAAITVVHTNGTSSGHSSHSEHVTQHSSQGSSNSLSQPVLQQQPQQQHTAGDASSMQPLSKTVL